MASGGNDSKSPLCWFRDLGLAAQLTSDGNQFTLSGLAALDQVTREAVSARAREQKTVILAQLQIDAANDARLEANPPELWPLVCHYTSAASVGRVLTAHGLRVRVVEDDFCLCNSNRVAWGLLPKVTFFFRHNGDLINEWLRGEHGTERNI